MELINGNSELIKEFFQSMDRMLDGGKFTHHCPPPFTLK